MTKFLPEEPKAISTPVDPIVVGTVVGAFGIGGGIKVKSLTDSPGRFLAGNTLYLDGQLMRLEDAKWNSHGVVLKLDLVNDRTHAQSLNGAALTISATEVEPLAEGSYYHFEIIGIGIWTEDTEYLGKVKEILVTGSNDVYVVDYSGKELLIPAIKSVILNVDIENHLIAVDLPKGLL